MFQIVNFLHRVLVGNNWLFEREIIVTYFEFLIYCKFRLWISEYNEPRKIRQVHYGFLLKAFCLIAFFPYSIEQDHNSSPLRALNSLFHTIHITMFSTHEENFTSGKFSLRGHFHLFYRSTRQIFVQIREIISSFLQVAVIHCRWSLLRVWEEFTARCEFL